MNTKKSIAAFLVVVIAAMLTFLLVRASDSDSGQASDVRVFRDEIISVTKDSPEALLHIEVKSLNGKSQLFEERRDISEIWVPVEHLEQHKIMCWPVTVSFRVVDEQNVLLAIDD